MNGIRPQVSREKAWLLLVRQHTGWLKRVLKLVLPKQGRGDLPTNTRRQPKLEMVWMPCHHLRFPLSKDGREGAIELLIGGHDAMVTRLRGGGVEVQEVSDFEAFAPTLGDEDAVEIAREQLTLARVREPGWNNQNLDVGHPEIDLWQYPYWAYYYERRKGMLDVLLLDAVTGKPVGSRTKAAFLAAITAEPTEP